MSDETLAAPVYTYEQIDTNWFCRVYGGLITINVEPQFNTYNSSPYKQTALHDLSTYDAASYFLNSLPEGIEFKLMRFAI